MVEAQIWTLIGLLASALFTLFVQVRGLGDRFSGLEIGLSRRIDQLSAEMHRGFGELRGDIAVIKAQIERGRG